MDLANYAIMTILEMEEGEYTVAYADGQPVLAGKRMD